LKWTNVGLIAVAGTEWRGGHDQGRREYQKRLIHPAIVNEVRLPASEDPSSAGDAFLWVRT